MKWGRHWAPAALVSGALTAPAFYDALTDGRVTIEAAGIRFAIGLFVVAVMISFVSGLVENYQRQNIVAATRRRRTDVPPEPEPPDQP